MRILFCNIGWMKHYKGSMEDDVILNGGSYNEMKNGLEEANFSNLNGQYYGYVSQNNLSIHRIKGIKKDADEANDVLVVWVAKHEKLGSVIIGWYKNATVYKEFQEPLRLCQNRNLFCYNIKTEIENGYLLPVEERKFKIPRRNNKIDGVCMGQSNVWYADEKRHEKFLEKVIDYIENYEGNFIDYIEENELEEKLYIETKENDNLEDVLNKQEYLLDMLQIVNGFIDKDKFKKRDLLRVKIDLLFDLGFIDKSLEVIENIKTDSIFIFYKAYGYALNGRNEEAIKLFEEYLEIEKDDTEAIEYKEILENLIK